MYTENEKQQNVDIIECKGRNGITMQFICIL